MGTHKKSREMNCPHCDTSVDEHSSGRCLDAWVAEAVMGNPVFVMNNPLGVFYGNVGGKFSTDIAAAWEVVGRVNKGGHIVEIVNDMVAWSVTFIHVDELEKKYTSDWKVSLPTQICRAALNSTGVH